MSRDRYLTLTDQESEELLAEYAKIREHEKNNAAFKAVWNQYAKKYGGQHATKKAAELGVVLEAPTPPVVRSLAHLVGALAESKRIFLPPESKGSEEEEHKKAPQIVADLVRTYLVEEKSWAAQPEYKEFAGSGFTFVDQEPHVKDFIQREWKLSPTEFEPIWTQLSRFHFQSLVPSAITQALPDAVKRKNERIQGQMHYESHYFGNYYRKNGEIHFSAEMRHSVFDTADQKGSKVELPGTISCEYVLTPHGFRLERGYPRFSNTLLKELCLAKKGTIHLSPDAIELAKIEDEVRKIYQDTRLDAGSEILAPELQGMSDARAILRELETKLKVHLVKGGADAKRFMQERTEHLRKIKDVLVVDQYNAVVTSLTQIIAREAAGLVPQEDKQAVIKRDAVDQARDILTAVLERKQHASVSAAELQTLTKVLDGAAKLIQDPTQKDNNAYKTFAEQLNKSSVLQKISGLMLGLVGLVATVLYTAVAKPGKGVAIMKAGAATFHGTKPIAAKMLRASETKRGHIEAKEAKRATKKK